MGERRSLARYPTPTPATTLQRMARVVFADPASVMLLQTMLGALVIVAERTTPRLAVVLAATAVLLILSRLRHAKLLATVLLAGFATAVLLHATVTTIPRPGTAHHHPSRDVAARKRRV